jgi:hypothetical protein
MRHRLLRESDRENETEVERSDGCAEDHCYLPSGAGKLPYFVGHSISVRAAGNCAGRDQ